VVRDEAENAPVTGGNRSVGHGPGNARRAIPPVDERGTTLVEVVLTVVLVGLVVVTLVSALFTMTVASDRHRRLAVADAELRRYAEWLRARPYVVCAPAGAASPYGFDAIDDPDVPTGLTARVVGVELWRYDDPSEGLAGEWVAVAPDCGASGGQVDAGLQRVVVELQSDAGTDGALTRTISLVKRTTELSS
jgi:hypothetical protein